MSSTIEPTSVLGTLLKGIFSFSPTTTWFEAAAWTLYLVPTMFFFLRRTRRLAITCVLGVLVGTSDRSLGSYLSVGTARSAPAAVCSCSAGARRALHPDADPALRAGRPD